MPAAENPAFVDHIVLERPRGVYTGESRRIHKRSKSASEMSDSAREYSIKKHRRAVSLQPYIREDGKLNTEAQAWTPKPLSDGTYASPAMRELCELFGTLAAEIVQGFAEGK